MIGLREFCTLLLAGGMGAGSVVAVQEVKPRITKARAVPKAKPAAARPAAPPARPFQAEGSSLEDCPIYAPLPGSPLANLGLPANPQPDLGGGLLGVGPGLGGGAGGIGGGGGGGGLPGPAPGPGPGGVVPEPAAWAMMVSGFGLIGVALRRRGGVAAPAAGTGPGA